MKISSLSNFMLLLFLIGILSSCQKTVDNSAADIAELKASVAALQKRSDSLAAALSATNSNVNNLNRTVDSIKLQLTGITLQLTQLNIQLTSINSNITVINAQIVILNQQYADLLSRLLAILVQLTNTPSSLNSGLIAYYPFTGNANDSSGNGNNGTVMPSVFLTNDRFGNSNSAYSFNGVGNTTEGRIFINKNFFDNGWNQYAISGWYYLNASGSTNTNNENYSNPIFNTSPHNSMALILNWGQNPTSLPNKYSLWIGNGAPSTSWNIFSNQKSTQSIDILKWTHILLQKNGTTYSLFVNGTMSNSWVASSAIQSYLCKMYLGGCDPINSREVMNGKLDDIYIYNRTLTQSEITYLATH